MINNLQAELMLQVVLEELERLGARGVVATANTGYYEVRVEDASALDQDGFAVAFVQYQSVPWTNVPVEAPLVRLRLFSQGCSRYGTYYSVSHCLRSQMC